MRVLGVCVCVCGGGGGGGGGCGVWCEGVPDSWQLCCISDEPPIAVVGIRLLVAHLTPH